MQSLRNIGRRLLGALSVTGQFKTVEAAEIDRTLGDVERDMRERSNEFSKAFAAPYGESAPKDERHYNRTERSQLRRNNRHRVSRAVRFHEKRGNPYDHKDGITSAQPRLVHESVVSRGVHFLHNPLLQKLLWSSGAMDAKHTTGYTLEDARS